jgi:acyl transferase domain-containing protein/acyl carrier protein
MSELFERISKLSPKRLALLVMEMQARLDALEREQDNAIAVIGMACRFPGSDSPEAFWHMLHNGVDAIRETPASRWDVDAYYDPDPNAPGKIATRWGGFLDNIDQFEPQFFGISPREAVSMDPQQRLLLEVAWEALERAGYAPDQLHGTLSGTFVGICNHDYSMLLMEGDGSNFDMYLSTGNAASVASGRLSYVLGLQGPSVSVDTACSSSLVAVHLAIQSLRDKQCRVALAGGVNAIISPKTSMTLSRAKMLAPDGRCKAFDARADGFVRSEGCGLVVLKRLTDALSDGDNVLAVIRGSAINQDGRSNGLTAPNGPSQISVIRAALADARIEPGDVGYIETHGTGTSLGDPIEAQALGAVFGNSHSDANPLMIGSVKANLGHMESAAGIGGLMKAILALQYGEIPPQIHHDQPNPYIPWSELPLALPRQATPWSDANKRRIAGVSSFGFSGTNAHIMLEAAPAPQPQTTEFERPLHILKLAARSDEALRTLVQRYVDYLAAHPEQPFTDIAYTTAVGRSDFSRRLAVVAGDVHTARSALAAFLAGNEPESWVSGTVSSGRTSDVVWFFTGHGAHYPGMGRQLYATQPIFRKALDQCAELLATQMDRPLLEVLFSEPESDGSHALDQMAYSQPALFALQYALTELWRSWGARPAAVVGHSAGEYVAAVVAGVFSLEDGLRLIATRGRLMQTLPPDGAMLAAMIDEPRATELLADYGGAISIAAINGPQSIVFSGTHTTLEQLATTMERDGIETRRLAIPVAAHSPQIEPILTAFEQVARTVNYHPPRIDVISGMTGRMAEGTDLQTADYWRNHLRRPVRFGAAAQTVFDQGRRVFLEIGPHPTLLGMARRFLPQDDTVWLPSLRSGSDEWAQILQSVAGLYAAGGGFDWAGFDQPYSRRRVELPTTPFQRERYWGVPANSGSAQRYRVNRGHPLAGERIRSPHLSEIVFESRISTNWPAYLDQHRIFGNAILPGPAYLEMALAAATQAFGSVAFTVEDLAIREALILPETSDRIVQVLLHVDDGGTRFEIFSCEESQDDWLLHASGRLAREERASTTETLDRNAIEARCEEQIGADDYYARLQELGVEFGESFRGLDQIHRRDGEALARVTLPTALAAEAPAYTIHPAFLDACFHLLGAAFPSGEDPQSALLIAIERFRLYARPGSQIWNHTQIALDRQQVGETLSGDIRLYDDDGNLIGEALGLHLKQADRETLQRMLRRLPEDWLYEVQWRPAPLLSEARSPLANESVARLNTSWGSLSTTHNLAAYRTALPDLEMLSTAYVRQALRHLGWQLQNGTTFTTTELAEQLQIVPQQRRLFERFVTLLVEDGILHHQAGRFTVMRSLDQVDDPGRKNAALRTKHPLITSELNLAERCGSALAEVLGGTTDPLGLLFPGGSQADTEAIYRDSPFALAFNELARQAVVEIVADQPIDRRLRVLEIGGGSAATTAAILPVLPAANCDYCFSDISPLFTNRAAERFGATYRFLYAQPLDIERDPLAQGFGESEFDLVIAANVLHATADVQQSLAHVQTLLAPGGKLLLIEGVRPSRWADITFGLTDGWWRFQDSETRSAYPLLDRRHWHAVLTATGYSVTTIIPGNDAEDIVGQACILAQAPDTLEAESAGESWLILDEPGGLGQHVAEMLEAQGAAVQFAPATSNATLEQIVTTLENLPTGTEQRIVACNGLATPEPADQGLAAFTQPGQPVEMMLQLMQALASRTETSKLWIVTRGAQPVTTPVTAPAQASLWGLGRVMALEHAEHWGGLIDLATDGDAQTEATQLLQLIRNAGDEDQLALRGGTAYIARLDRSEPRPAQLPTFRHAASYLITGGLGGLGLKLAHWMAEHGAGTLVLMGRKGMPPRTEWSTLPTDSRAAAQAQAIGAIESLGTRVHVVAADVADETAMATLFERFGTELPALHGIIHAAADLNAATIAEMHVDALRSMLRPKLAGTWLLHQLSRDVPLDFFVLFSSTTALWGSARLGHYAAANHFLDAFAHYRRSQGLPALSINWGTWDEMRVASADEQQAVSGFGLRPMPSDQALLVLGSLIDNAASAQHAVAAVDWNTLKPAYEARRVRPFLAEMATVTEAYPLPDPTTPPPAEHELRRIVDEAAPEEHHERIVEYLTRLVARVLGMPANYPVDIETGLFEMGMDSLMSVELKSRIEAAVGMDLPTTLTFNYPTVTALADFLHKKLQAAPATTPVPSAVNVPETGTTPITTDIDDLSEDDLAALLSDRLSKLQ